MNVARRLQIMCAVLIALVAPACSADVGAPREGGPSINGKFDEFSEHAPTADTYVEYFNGCALQATRAQQQGIALSETESNAEWGVDCMVRVNDWAAPLVQERVDRLSLEERADLGVIEPVATTFDWYHAAQRDFCQAVAGTYHNDEQLAQFVSCRTTAEQNLGRLLILTDPLFDWDWIDGTSLAQVEGEAGELAAIGALCFESATSSPDRNPDADITDDELWGVEACLFVDLRNYYGNYVIPSYSENEGSALGTVFGNFIDASDRIVNLTVAAIKPDHDQGRTIDAPNLSSLRHYLFINMLEYATWAARDAYTAYLPTDDTTQQQ